MKPILVATDLSAQSDWAIERAVKLAATHDTKLVVLHVVADEFPSRIADRMRDDAEALLKEFVSRLESAEFATVEIKCGFGEHFASIINVADALNAELVVIGKHREDRLRDLFKGSTGERVIRFGNRPVLVVKQRPSHAYLRIMVGIDFSPASARAIEFVATVAPGASMQVAHAFHFPFKGFLHGGKPFDQLAKRQQQAFE